VAKPDEGASNSEIPQNHATFSTPARHERAMHPCGNRESRKNGAALFHVQHFLCIPGERASAATVPRSVELATATFPQAASFAPLSPIFFWFGLLKRSGMCAQMLRKTVVEKLTIFLLKSCAFFCGKPA